jgi:hypothetical protein
MQSQIGFGLNVLLRFVFVWVYFNSEALIRKFAPLRTSQIDSRITNFLIALLTGARRIVFPKLYGVFAIRTQEIENIPRLPKSRILSRATRLIHTFLPILNIFHSNLLCIIRNIINKVTRIFRNLCFLDLQFCCKIFFNCKLLVMASDAQPAVVVAHD